MLFAIFIGNIQLALCQIFEYLLVHNMYTAMVIARVNLYYINIHFGLRVSIVLYVVSEHKWGYVVQSDIS